MFLSRIDRVLIFKNSLFVYPFLELTFIEDFLIVLFYSLALCYPVDGWEAIDLFSLLVVVVLNYLLPIRALVTYCSRAWLEKSRVFRLESTFIEI